MKAMAFTSPLADGIERFLQYKRSLGCRYRTEEGLLRCFDRFLGKHLKAADPVISLDVVRAYVSPDGRRSETTRGHRLSLIRELCRFLAIEDPRTEVPPRRFLGIHPRPFIQRVLSRQEGKGGSSFFSMTVFWAFSGKVLGLDVPIRSMDTMEVWTLWHSGNWWTSSTFRTYG